MTSCAVRFLLRAVPAHKQKLYPQVAKNSIVSNQILLQQYNSLPRFIFATLNLSYADCCLILPFFLAPEQLQHSGFFSPLAFFFFFFLKGSKVLKGKCNKTVNYSQSLLNKCNLVKFRKIFTFAYICNFTAELLVFLTYATLKCIRNPLVCYMQQLLLIYNTQFRKKNTTKPDLNHRLLCKTQARNYSKS